MCQFLKFYNSTAETWWPWELRVRIPLEVVDWEKWWWCIIIKFRAHNNFTWIHSSNSGSNGLLNRQVRVQVSVDPPFFTFTGRSPLVTRGHLSFKQVLRKQHRGWNSHSTLQFKLRCSITVNYDCLWSSKMGVQIPPALPFKLHVVKWQRMHHKQSKIGAVPIRATIFNKTIEYFKQKIEEEVKDD